MIDHRTAPSQRLQAPRLLSTGLAGRRPARAGARRRLLSLTLCMPLLMLPPLSLVGCGAPARPLELAITDMDSLQLRSWLSPQLRRNVDLEPVLGGQETNRLWGTRISDMSLNQAYQESLRRVGLMPDVPDTGRYQLKVEVLAVAQPNVPVSPEVAVAVRYTLTERTAQKPVYQRTLRTTQKAGLDDSLSPNEQLRIATEGALRANIAELLRELASLPLPA
ncbi:hypothetical protein OU995_07110 [Roseateles sp. SL47]|uniref:hypothetical protein n=1 Tax=Roseateles sp. SL47 TaxID=2995138 RepID=UPI00226F631C|nr:hypothetical protein [Roseateles sp. SL47]WAC74479.1 hypothetical protein OU995_07110 [Roseateles sp. SL47]